MACEIIYKNNIPTGVYDKNGTPSKFFNQILNNPHVSTFDDALQRYLNVAEQDEQPLQYITVNGQIFDDFADALKSIDKGEIIAFSGDTELFSVSSDINTKSFNGLINNLIKNDLILPSTVLDVDGTKLYKPKGDELKKHITSDLAITTARGTMGVAAHRNAAGDLYFDMDLIGKRAATNKEGETVYLTEEQYAEKSFRSFEDPTGVLAERAYRDDNRAFGNTKPVDEIEIIPENLLQEKLLNLLQQLGIKTISLETYSKKYNPDISALADIANKLIAFRDGTINQEDLTEEVSHFIVEASEPVELENLLRNVHRTTEWAQFEQAYREIYAQEYSGQELEEVVRKEILGKVLANSLQNNFNQNRPSPTENSIIGRLRDIFNTLINRVNNFFKPAHKQELDRYLDSIYANLMQDSLYEELNPSQLDGKKYVLYSIDQAGVPAEYRQYQKALEHLTNQQYQLAKKYSAPASKNMLREAKQELEKSIQDLESEIQKLHRLKALSNIATVATSQLNYLAKVIDTNTNKGYHFAQEENSVYQNFMTKLRPMLSQISGQLNTKDKTEKDLKDKIDAALKKSLELEAKVPASNEIAIKNMVERVIQKTNMTETEANRYRDQLNNVLTTAQKDTNWFHAHLGQLVHAQNMLLNLAGDVISKTVTESRQAFLPRIKQFLNELEEAGFDPKQLKKLIDKNGYIIHEIDNGKLEEINKQIQADIYNSITGNTIQAKDFTPELVQNLNVEQRTLFEASWRTEEKARTESFFTQEYLDRLENFSIEVNAKTLRRVDLPQIALDYEQQYRGQLTEIRVNNGGINSENDKAEIQGLNKQRANNSNPRNIDGSLKKGLVEIYDETRGQYVLELSGLENLDDESAEEAQRVYGLQTINLLNREFYAGTEQVRNIPQAFIDKLNEFETEQEKWDFVQLNAYVGFKPDFWDNFGTTASLNERLQDQKNGENDAEVDELISDIRGQQQIIANILKANRVFNRPSETDVVNLEDIAAQEIKDATIQLESLYSKANALLPREEQVDVERLFESRTNEAYRSDLENQGIITDEEKIAFILKHVTPNNRQAIDNAVRVVNKIKEGDADVVIKKSLQNIFNENMSAAEAQTALIKYAESKLLPYYKRTEPVGFSEEYNKVRQDIGNNVEGAVENYIQNSEYTQISPSYSFSQNESINPKWLANRDAKRSQYTQEFLGQIRNEEFFSRYGVDQNGNATRNIEEWKARESLLNLQDWSLENYDATGAHDRYLLPQQHKSGFRRLTGFLGNIDTKAIGQSLLDVVNFREDETETGQDEQGNIITNSSQILSIPKYGLRKLNEPTDVTDELLYSYAWMASQSSLYKSRKENISNMFALNDALLNTDFAGKSSESTNAYKMFRSFLNSNYYGQRETFSYEVSLLGKKINLGKLARVFNSWVRMVSLASFSVPFTSLLQAKVQRFIESKVGELTNPIALKLARKEFHVHAKKAAGEIMGLTSKAKINVLGEAYGMYDLGTTRFENSNYNKATRGVMQISSGVHSLGNFPVLPTTMLSILYDYRYVDGEILNYNQYIRRNQNTDRKQLDTDWQRYELFYDDIIVKDGIQTYNNEAISQKTGLTEEQLETRIQQLHETMTNRITESIQSIDSSIPEFQKSIAARDARASFFLMFQNWFLLALQSRFKSKGYNISRELETEGSWITTGKFIQDLIIRRRDVKTAWREAMNDPLKKRNLRRTVVELGVANAMAVVAILLSNYADDEDDPMFGLAFLDYFATRVSAEQISGTVALPRQFGQIIESPLAAADRFYDLFNVTDVLSSEQVTRGSFAGETERYKWLSQNMVWFKDYHRLSNLKRSQDTYEFFNEGVYDYAAISWLLPEEAEE